uniref:Uncharacterized protein n=1 Tax=Anguilla anguilla TaxID=7936 RepID=A0A0E9TQD2_ANGAN
MILLQKEQYYKIEMVVPCPTKSRG